MSIKPFISPKELKARIDAGENWVPITHHEIICDLYSQTYECFGYEKVQSIGWSQGEEPSPLEVGIPMGVVTIPCLAKQEVIEDHIQIKYEPCMPLKAYYGLITENCERFIKKDESAPVEYVGKAVDPACCDKPCASE